MPRSRWIRRDPREPARRRGRHARACPFRCGEREMTQMGEHRVSMLGSLRRYEDPARSSDPRIRAVVAGLSTLEIAPPARAHFRAELRSQLVAVAPRLVAEGLSAEATPMPRAVIAEKPRPLPR